MRYIGMEIDFKKYYVPRDKQLQAHRNTAKYRLFGGAVGGGKSVWGCMEIIKHAILYKGTRNLILRETRTVLEQTTLLTFQKMMPLELVANFNRTKLEYTLINGSIIKFLGVDISRDPLLENLKGQEIGAFFIDEASQVPEDVYTVLRTRLRATLSKEARHWHSVNNNNEKEPRYIGMLTSNPEDCWLYYRFILATSEDEAYIESLTLDNYNEDDEYYKELLSTFKDYPELLKRYLEGDWSVVEKPNQLFSTTILQGLKENRIPLLNISGIGCDVARYGNDKTVITIIKNGVIYPQIELSKSSTKDVERAILDAVQTHQIANIAIDSVGLGAGVTDSLKEYPLLNITDFVAGSKIPSEAERLLPNEGFKCSKLKDFAYYLLHLSLKRRWIASQSEGVITQTLNRQLGAITYSVKGDKHLSVITSDELKKPKNLGFSPDHLVSLYLANYASLLTLNNSAYVLPSVS